EGKERIDVKGNIVFTGPKVAPRSSPIFQFCRIWETINNISLKIKNPEGSKYKWADFIPSLEQKKEIAIHLNTHASLSSTELLKILNLKKENVYLNKQLAKGIKGNSTYTEIASIIKNERLLQFNIPTQQLPSKAYLSDKKTGEILTETAAMVVEPQIEKEPLYQLWHTIYSIKESDECKSALKARFNLPEEEAEALAKIDFTKQSFGDKSTKAMRKILPYLMQGHHYADACSLAGYNHSNSLTKEEQKKLQTNELLENLPKNSLRQPVVEKILNQMINLVNAIIVKYGKPEEIRIELARELKQSKDERNDADKQNSLNKKLNDEIADRLKELSLPATKRYIQKYKFIFPVKDKKWNEAQAINQCIYCGETFNLSEALAGNSFDVDHIIPQALLFDDSQTNKVLVHRKCNKDKTNTTAYDYIATKGDKALADYIARVDDWYMRGAISYSKMQRLKTSYKEYLERKSQKKETEADKRLWENFIDRQLRESAYISRKARYILQKICNQVHTTEGTVTAKLRQLWGWEDVLLQLQLPKYKELQLTEIKEWQSDHGKRKHQKEEIKDWSKRDDHRHHALDALVIACTKQGFIQRINTLNASEVRNEMNRAVEIAGIEYNEKLTLLEKYLLLQQPFTTDQVKEELSKILISFKPGKKVASSGSRKIKVNGKKQVVQKNIIVPRGPLSEESVYGKIKTTEFSKPLKYLFENPHLIFKTYIKEKVEQRLAEYDGDVKKAISSLKKSPIYLDDKKTKLLEYGTCYKEEVVIKYPIASIKAKDLEFIVDKKVRELIKQRLEEFNNKEKDAFKNLEENPLWYNKEKKIPIKTVRCFTSLTAVEPVKKDIEGNAIGFVKPGNNHHIAIYLDENGKRQEHLCSFWHAVERKKYKLPVIIKNPSEVWDKVLTQKENFPESFLEKLPGDKWTYEESLQQNEMFVLGMIKEDIEKAIKENNKALISKHLYHVWSISESDYWFKHHLETKNTELKAIESAKESKRYFRFKSISSFTIVKPLKVKVDRLGDISIIKKNADAEKKSKDSMLSEPDSVYGKRALKKFESFEDMENDQLAFFATLTPEELLRNHKRLSLAAFGFKNEGLLQKPDRTIKFD
ncbi:MAG TPA: HNH endonuclease domain-containing protein, partial [Chitinophagaceae bacterium]|nr:HNH endonuclease domain-containing protein [Chitinophagaceae bacterium]